MNISVDLQKAKYSNIYNHILMPSERVLTVSFFIMPQDVFNSGSPFEIFPYVGLGLTKNTNR